MNAGRLPVRLDFLTVPVPRATLPPSTNDGWRHNASVSPHNSIVTPQCFNAAPQCFIVTAADPIAIAQHLMLGPQHSIAMAQHPMLRGDNASAAAQPKMLSMHNAIVIEKLRIFTRHISICLMHNASFIAATQSFTLCNAIADLKPFLGFYKNHPGFIKHGVVWSQSFKLMP
jgi:hypothetical protein